MGVKSIYTEELADQVCKKIAEGKSILSIEKEEGMPSKATIYNWLFAEKPGFLDKYNRARAAQADVYAQEITDIADDATNDFYTNEKGEMVQNNVGLQRAKMRMDARKWVAARLKPRKYGESSSINHSGDQSSPLNIIVNKEPVGSDVD